MAQFAGIRDEGSARQARFGAMATLYTLIVVGVLVMTNWLANRYNKTFDTTSNKRYTLSDQTKKIITDLKQDATISYLDNPGGFEQARGMLDRYRNLSNKVHLEYIDVKREPTRARQFGLRYTGTAYVTIGKKREEARSVTEEGITGAFVKDLKSTRKVCFVTGNRERQLDETQPNGLSRLKQNLERDNYDVQPLPLLEKPDVPKDCQVVVAAGPQSSYPAIEANALKSYVENGGRAMLLLDPPLQMGRMRTAPNEELDKLLAGWGVTLDADLVLEQNTVSQIFGFGPEVPLISSFESHPIVNDLKGSAVALPLTQSLTIKNADKTTVQKLLSSSARAIATTNLSASQVNIDDPKNKKGPFVLGAAGTYNTGKSDNQGRFVAFGTASFVENSTLGFEANGDLALNSINWLSSDEDLISIRPKQPEDRRLNASGSQMNVFLYTVLIALPLLIIASGASIYLRRR